MSKTLFWLQCGGCGGDSMSFINVQAPNIIELLSLLEVEVLWHPSFSRGTPGEYGALVDDLMEGRRPLDLLCVEGTVVRGPGGTGMYDTFLGKPKKDLVAGLARQAGHVLAVGTCASFGGLGAGLDIEATGLQFLKRSRGGFLGESFVSREGTPVINLPGCPCHPGVVAGTLTALWADTPPTLNELGSPVEWYGLLVHQGCVRNEYHEYRVEERDFGEKGCLFFHLGCRGPLSHGPCNKLLWNQRSSKTRIGVPCLGCTQPEFPQDHPFFQTPNIVGIPLELPDGVDRAHYMAYKGMAAAAAPERLKKRVTRL